ncbi:MAG: PilZ domain-containing protein [Candidatus Thiodiazotropha sp.]
MDRKRLAQQGMMKASDSEQLSTEFINRIEKQRLDGECLRSLDLRPYVTEPCKLYSYRGRGLWLNAEAHQLFLQGLNSNAGVFTIDTYESMLRHFSIDLEKPLQNSSGNGQDKTLDKPHSSTLIVASTVLKTDQTDSNLAIDLSYFERRVYDRIKTSFIIGLIWKGKTFTAETRDISQSGLQLRVRTPIDLEVNDIVRIDVTPLVNRELKNPILDYRVIRTRRLLAYTFLGLQCIEKNAKDGLSAISEYMAEGALSEFSEQTDPEDALLTAKALLAERFYMRSTSTLPFFIFENQEDQLPLRIIFGNGVNKRFLDVFENADGSYDFSSLVTPRRIKLVTRLALRDSKADTLIAVFRPRQGFTPKVIADLECKNYKHWHRLLVRYGAQPGFRIFKVVARMARRPVEMRIEDALEPLNGKDNEFLNKLLTEAKRLSIVGALIDVTDHIRTSWRSINGFNPNRSDQPAICQNEEQPFMPPQLIPIHYIQENRSEQRYLGQVKVEVIIAGLIYQGVTRDVSAHGLSIELDEPYATFIHHRQATISFPGLSAITSNRLRNKQTFRNIPAEIVGKPSEGEQVLRLKICDNAKGRQFTSEFSSLLSKRDSDLCKDYSHSLRAATSRLYSSIFIESASTLPIFIYHSDNKDWSFRIGLTNSPSPLIDYFEVADSIFDFSALTIQCRLQQLMREVTNDGSGEITLYLSKVRRKNTPTFIIRSLADFEMADIHTRNAFVENALDTDFRCIKIRVNLPNVPPKAEIDQAVDRLVQLSQGKSERLKTEFDNLIAIGDIVDVTGLITENLSLD